jgi:predicted HD phosphohydrolase
MTKPAAVARQRASFAAMTEGTDADWAAVRNAAVEYAHGVPDRVLAHLALLGGDYGGLAVDRLEHCLQTATRAARGGEDDEYVVCALLHDIGDPLGPYNHAGIAAAVLEPYVSEANRWMVAHHDVFQGYYYFHFYGLDRNMRDRYLGEPFYDRTAHFSEEYDQPAFDPNYKSLTLADLAPAVRSVLRSPVRSIYVPSKAPKRD